MLLREIVAAHATNVHRVVQLGDRDLGLADHLRLPEHAHLEVQDLESAATLDLGPGTAVVSLLGPNPDVHADPVALADVLGRLQPGARGILLLAWPVTDLPSNRLLDLLRGGYCQI